MRLWYQKSHKRSRLVTRNIEQDELLRVAAEWSAELSAAEVSPLRIAQWQQWLAASDAHREAFDRIQSTLLVIDRSAGEDLPWPDRKSTRLHSSHTDIS